MNPSKAVERQPKAYVPWQHFKPVNVFTAVFILFYFIPGCASIFKVIALKKKEYLEFSKTSVHNYVMSVTKMQ